MVNIGRKDFEFEKNYNKVIFVLMIYGGIYIIWKYLLQRNVNDSFLLGFLIVTICIVYYREKELNNKENNCKR